MFPNSTIKTIKGGSFVAAEQYVSYNIQASTKEHQKGMDNLHILHGLPTNISRHQHFKFFANVLPSAPSTMLLSGSTLQSVTRTQEKQFWRR